jgi:hypothetical protein
VLGRNAEDTAGATSSEDEVRDQVEAAVERDGDRADDWAVLDTPVMPAPPFPTFSSRPTLPHQVPGVGFESGRDSRAR